MSADDGADDGECTFYFGGAGGSAQKALRVMSEPNVLVSYATKNNRPWDGIERLFVDSGGYSVLGQGPDYETTDAEYLQYLAALGTELEYWALRDYPVDDEYLERYDRTVSDHQRMTTDRHISVLDELGNADVGGSPVCVVQGDKPIDYAEHVDDLRDHGVLTDHVGVGSLVGREPEETRAILRTVREAVDPSRTLHGFGVSRDVLRFDDAVQAIDSADSCAYEQRARKDAREGEPCDYRHMAFHFYKFQRRVRDLTGAGPADTDRGESHPDQTTVEQWGEPAPHAEGGSK